MAERNWRRLAGIVAAVMGCLLGSTALFVFYWPYVHRGVTIDGIAVGGQKRDTVIQLLRAYAGIQQDKAVVLFYNQTSYRVDLKQIDYQADVDGTVQSAWAIGHDGSVWQRLRDIHRAWHEGIVCPLQFSCDEQKLQRLLQTWAQDIDQAAHNASYSLTDGTIIAEKPGRRLNIHLNQQRILAALQQQNDTALPLEVSLIQPKTTAADLALQGIVERVAVFDTAFDSSDINRTANIRLAAEMMNGTVLQPGQVLSFNQVVGRRDADHGFKEALEIVNGDFVPGIGGGVCQVSSTLYNAALLANMNIVERHNHSRPLTYVGLGRDATVVNDFLDLKFKNPLMTPVVVIAEVRGNRVYVGLFGSRTADLVEIVTTDMKVLRPGVTKKDDPTLYVGEVVEEKPGQEGYEVTMIRVVHRNHLEVSRSILSHDVYTPVDAIVRVGTQQPVFTQPVEDKPQMNDKLRTIVPPLKKEAQKP